MYLIGIGKPPTNYTITDIKDGWKSCRIVEISDWFHSPTSVTFVPCGMMPKSVTLTLPHSTPRLEYSSDKPTRITPEGREGGCKKTKGVKKKIGIAAIFRWHIHWMIGSMHREDISTLKKTVLLLVSSFEFDFCFSSKPGNLPFLLLDCSRLMSWMWWEPVPRDVHSSVEEDMKKLFGRWGPPRLTSWSTKGFLATTVVRSMQDSKKTFTQSLHNLNFNIETKYLRFEWNPVSFCGRTPVHKLDKKEWIS